MKNKVNNESKFKEKKEVKFLRSKMVNERYQIDLVEPSWELNINWKCNYFLE